jgi:hypothetical protein
VVPIPKLLVARVIRVVPPTLNCIAADVEAVGTIDMPRSSVNTREDEPPIPMVPLTFKALVEMVVPIPTFPEINIPFAGAATPVVPIVTLPFTFRRLGEAVVPIATFPLVTVKAALVVRLVPIPTFPLLGR